MASATKTYGSLAEALEDLLPGDESSKAPAAIPASTAPWPEGGDVAADIFRKLASQLKRAAERTT